MDDLDLFAQINALAAEEERLYASAGDGGGLTDAQRDRLGAINVELDRCYDLLHQRVGRRDAGLSAAEARPRSRDVIDRYEQ